MKQKLSLVTLGVSDLQVSRDFYERVLGFTPEATSNEQVAFYDMGGCLLSLFARESLAEDIGISSEGEGFRGATLAHNEPSKEAVDQLFAALRECDVKIIKNPQEVFWGGYSGYFLDPDNHVWEVAYNPFMDLT